MTPSVEMIVPRDADPGLRVCCDAWAEGLRARGFGVGSEDVTNASHTATMVIVEPHAALRPIADDPMRIAGILRRAVCLSTSRLGSGALGADRPYHAGAAASVALSRDASRYLTAHGVPTRHLEPGSHPSLRSPSPGPRTITVGAHARYSIYREELLAQSRDVLDAHACDLRISTVPADLPPGLLAPHEWLPWLVSLDILVSLPTEPGPGIDWCEAIPAIVNGALVLTTAESDFGPLEPGEDVAVATSAGFADALRRLLADDGRRERMRESARAKLEAHPLEVTPLAEAILSTGTGEAHVRPLRAAVDVVRQRSPGVEPDTEAAHAAAEAARTGRAAARSGAVDRVTTTSGWDAETAPAVSVVIPSYNQAGFVRAAVESALAARGVALEVVVVDDGSADESVAAARNLLSTHDARALKLVEHADNAGLSSARNRGFTEARAPLVLLLDADDELLPHGPLALFRALSAAPDAAFAYGMLARVGLEHEDLLGTEPWDPALFRHGNYVPVTCSLVRRSAWQLVGGYLAEGLLELGWEDMDFWLRLAAAGQRAVHVRHIVGVYRVHGVSMSTLTNTHAAALMEFLRARHPALMSADDA